MNICSNCNKKQIIPPAALKAAKGNLIVICRHCKSKNIINMPIKNSKTISVSNLHSTSLETGWLIVHDENTTAQTFSLKIGKQIIGRKSENKPCDIMIDTEDMSMSRNHFMIEVVLNKKMQYDYIITDNGALNHTYLNQKRVGAGESLYLSDGYEIQAGETKIIFKEGNPQKSKTDLEAEVHQKPYFKTVVINKK